MAPVSMNGNGLFTGDRLALTNCPADAQNTHWCGLRTPPSYSLTSSPDAPLLCSPLHTPASQAGRMQELTGSSSCPGLSTWAAGLHCPWA